MTPVFEPLLTPIRLHMDQPQINHDSSDKTILEASLHSLHGTTVVTFRSLLRRM